jgi:SHS family lactate transporter-like MFS transporter
MQESTTPVATEGHRAALVAGFLGWTFVAFDFFLVVVSLTTIAKEFHRSDKEIALSIALTLGFRPVGALIFGLLSDRYGRRLPLMLNVVYYSVIELLTGLAPNYTTFMVLRALFGIGMGAQWGVGASLTMEKVPARRRGVLSGLLQEGYATGYLLAALCSLFVLPQWGWRPLFFVGSLPALLAFFVHFKVKESEVWKRTRHESWQTLFRGIASHWRLFLYLIVFMTLMNFVSHGTQDMYPTFLERYWGFNPGQRAIVTIVSMVGAIIGGIVFGLVSDRIGRRYSMILALVCAVLVVPLWAFAPSLALLISGAFLMQFMVQGAWGIIPAHLSELSPDSVRGFLPGFAYQCGVLLAGSVAYLEALFAEHMSYSVAMALTAATVFVLSAIAAATGGEQHGIDFASSAAPAIEVAE